MTKNAAVPVRLALECSVVDATILWDAAASRAAQDFAMMPDDVVDTIGPRQDPDLEACMSLLFDSLVRPSGAFDAVTITTLRAGGDVTSITPPVAARALPVIASLTTRAA